MIQKKKKPTTKEIVQMIAGVMVQLEQLKAHVFNGDKALDEYIQMKGEKEAFVKFLEKKYKEDDKDPEKAEDK